MGKSLGRNGCLWLWLVTHLLDQYSLHKVKPGKAATAEIQIHGPLAMCLEKFIRQCQVLNSFRHSYYPKFSMSVIYSSYHGSHIEPQGTLKRVFRKTNNNINRRTRTYNTIRLRYMRSHQYLKSSHLDWWSSHKICSSSLISFSSSRRFHVLIFSTATRDFWSPFSSLCQDFIICSCSC